VWWPAAKHHAAVCSLSPAQQDKGENRESTGEKTHGSKQTHYQVLLCEKQTGFEEFNSIYCQLA